MLLWDHQQQETEAEVLANCDRSHFVDHGKSCRNCEVTDCKSKSYGGGETIYKLGRIEAHSLTFSISKDSHCES